MWPYEIGVLAGLLTVFINYCIGKPSSDKFSPYEIFSFYTVWLSKQRLKRIGLYKHYEKQYDDGILRIDKGHEVLNLRNDFKKMLYEAAEPFFTWERAVGMCPVCSGLWTSIAFGFLFTQNLLSLLIIVLVSHLIIRITIKFL